MISARRVRVAAVCAVATGVWSLSTVVSGTAQAASVPYTDAHSKGSIGFCDANGHEVTSGKITDRPFAPFVVSGFRPPAPYDQPGATTWLIAYQPRKGVDPGNWSGFQLTASSTYTVPAYPKAEVLPQDRTLSQAVNSYPPQWDGLLQLRMYFKANNEPVASGEYPSADVRISGDQWTLVRGGGVSCTKSGEAQSVARSLIPDKLTTTPGIAASDGPPATSSADASAGIDGGSTGPQTKLATASSTSAGGPWILSAVAAGFVAIVGAGLFRARKKLRS